MTQMAAEAQAETAAENIFSNAPKAENLSLSNTDLIAKLHEDARSFLHKLGFFFEEDFYETHDKEVIKFKIEKDKKKINCWLKCRYPLRKDGTIGLCITFGAHHTSLAQHDTNTFWADSNFQLTDEERQRINERLAEGKQRADERAKEEKRISDEQANWCIEKYKNASIRGTSPYFERKGIIPSDIRYEIRRYYSEGNNEETIALIPLRDIKGQLRALQEIYPTKRLINEADKKLRDKNSLGKYSGCFFSFGKLEDGKTICIAEGYATAASIFESTNYTSLMVVGRTNILNVGREIKRKFLNSEIIICGDDDIDTNGNPGRTDAVAAAQTLKCRVVFPSFSEDKKRKQDETSYKDFNDLMLICGKEEVRVQIENSIDSNDQEETEFFIDDQSDNECNSTDISKATANARRRAITNQATLDEIFKDICKQHSTLKDQAKDIAKKALLWAKNFQPGREVIVNGIPKTITDMMSLDSRLAQLEAPGQPCVIVNRKDALPITNADFNKRLSGEVVVVGVNEKGQPKYVAANKFWEGSTHKHIYRNIVFTNKPINNSDYNLFTGFGITPKQGNCNKILNHIKEVVCAGDEINDSALLKLLAWQMQNIGRPSRIITALKSIEQQIGKGCLLGDVVAPIYGNAGFTTSDIGQIIGRFNDTIRGKAFIFLDECLFAGDRKAADAIKSLATATRIGVESKGVPTVQFPCATNLFLSTNHVDAAHIEEADARYWILEVSPHRKGDTNYFEELYIEINGGGLSAFMHYLLNLDVSGFVPQRDVPTDNEAKNKMIRNSINPYDARKWLEECCLARMILGCAPREEYKQAGYKWELWKAEEEYENGVFFTAYAEWQKNVRSPVAPKPTAANNFGALLNTAGLELRIDGERRRTLPDPVKCLKKVTEMLEKTVKK